jgi:predicted O-linked N-acetylglucosamine transferase (SPINDLY family)
MATDADMIALAVRYHQAGNVDQAEQLYRTILQSNPQHADAHHLLGVLAHQSGRHEDAIASIRRAVAINPSSAVYHCNLALAYKALGRLDEALASYRDGQRVEPASADIVNHIAGILRLQGTAGEAEAACREALRLRPAFAEAHNNLGNILRLQNRFDEAVMHYREALRIRPQFVEARWNLGAALIAQGRPGEAVDQYQEAVRLVPQVAEAHANLGDALAMQGDLDQAVSCYQQALQLTPGDSVLHGKLAGALEDLGKLDEALPHYRQAVLARPESAAAHNDLGNALFALGKMDDAASSFREALRLDPKLALAWNNLANALAAQGKLDDILECYQRAVAADPDNAQALGGLVHVSQQMCRWEELEEMSCRAIAAAERTAAGHGADFMPPFTFLVLPTPTSAQQQLQCACGWVQQRFQAAMKQRTSLSGFPRQRSRHQIKLGYLSADFHAHATAYLIAELLEKHDRERFAVAAYSHGPDDGSATRRRLRSACDQFVDLRGVSFIDAARRIQADGIDILIDLKGHTGSARTEIAALRPAPIQVNYLGYPGTMGAPFIDYIIVDEFVVPPEQQPYFTEKLVHLLGCYQVNDSRRPIAAHTPSRKESGLPDSVMVFCCFNGNYKITPAIFDVWMDLLKAVPASVLWLMEGNGHAMTNLRREAEARGVAASRLVFAPPLPLPEHLARFGLADLFLDTFPVNAHTTASDALWVGCPVLTLAGQTFVSRVAASLLHAVGLPELVTASMSEYRDLALRLATDAELLNSMRTRLKGGRTTSGVFDGARFARNLEKAYTTMWQLRIAGASPRAFSVNQ